MNPPVKEEATSPVKKSKVKLPDIERALANWVRNEQKKGVTITDEKLKKQARFFSTTSPTNESQLQITSTAWLERFKQNNTINTAAKKGKPSNSDLVIVDSNTTSLSDTPIDSSPVSSVGLASPPISPDDIISQRDPNGDGADDFFEYGNRERFRDTTSLEHVLSSDLESSTAVLSPVSPELSRSAGAAANEPPPFSSNFSRQRSQTFPITEMETTSASRPPSSHNRGPPAGPVRSVTSDMIERPISINPRQTVKRHKSVPDIHDPEPVRFSSMQPPPLPKSSENSPIIQQRSSPTPEDAQYALDLLKSFFEAQQRTNVMNDGDAYIMIGKLMEKLKLLQRPSDLDLTLPGGMHPVEMVVDTSRSSKKRPLMGISE